MKGIVEPSLSYLAQIVLVNDEFDPHKNACVWTTQTLLIYLQSLMRTHCQELKPL